MVFVGIVTNANQFFATLIICQTFRTSWDLTIMMMRMNKWMMRLMIVLTMMIVLTTMIMATATMMMVETMT